MQRHNQNVQMVAARSTIAALALLLAAGGSARADFVSTVLATSPLDFWTLQGNSQPSVGAGTDTSTYQNGAATVAAGAGAPQANAMSLDGNNATPQFAATGLSGGIPGTGSIMAWVNLAELPSTANAYFYVAGESAGGNDFDLQFQNDNSLYFFTGGGENTSYTPTSPSLVGTWHMIVATYTGGASGARDIYWDGSLVASFSGGVNSASKSSAFNIGYSTVFGNRDFNGLIADVAVWNAPISATQVSQIADAAGLSSSPIPAPAPLGVLGVGVAALLGLRRPRHRA